MPLPQLTVWSVPRASGPAPDIFPPAFGAEGTAPAPSSRTTLVLAAGRGSHKPTPCSGLPGGLTHPLHLPCAESPRTPTQTPRARPRPPACSPQSRVSLYLCALLFHTQGLAKSGDPNLLGGGRPYLPTEDSPRVGGALLSGEPTASLALSTKQASVS